MPDRVYHQKRWLLLTLLPLIALLVGLWLLGGSATAGKPASAGPSPQIAPSSPRDDALLVAHVTWYWIPQPDHRNTTETLTLRLKLQTGGPITSYSGYTDASGYFTASVASLPPGDYNYWAKGFRNLANGGVVTLSGALVTSVEVGTLRAGDASGDNIVNALDFVILKNSFARWCEQGCDMHADFDNNDIVNATDFVALKNNFQFQGAPPPDP